MKVFGFRILRLAVLLGALAAPVGASASEPGVVNGQAYKALPPGVAFSVVTLDESADNLALKDRFIQALTARGYAVVEGAPLVLRFDTYGALGSWSTDERHAVELFARGGRTGGEDAGVKVNLYDSTRGGVFNRGEGDTAGASTRYRLDVAVEDRDSGKPLWQGWATARLERVDQDRLTASMVGPLVAIIGQTVRKQPFATPED